MKSILRKKHHFYARLLLVGALVVFPNIFSGSVFAQITETKELQGELTLNYILEKLSSTKQPNQKIKNQAVLAYIKRSKDTLQFVMTDDEEAKLREAGADDAFIAYIAKVTEEMMKAPIGNLLMGNKYLNAAIPNYTKQRARTKDAWSSRFVLKNEDEARRLDAEAEQFQQVAQENARNALSYYNNAKLTESDSSNQFTAVAGSNLALAYTILADYDKAIDNINQSINIEPTSYRYFLRAYIYDVKSRTLQSPAEKDEKRAAGELVIKNCEMALSLDSTLGECRRLVKDIKDMWHIP